jgi:uncharacterized membrane protein
MGRGAIWYVPLLKLACGAKLMIVIVWVPTFKGGSGKYAALQNGVFVSSETFSASTVPGQFFIALKISQVFSSNTTTVIRDAFP